MCETNNETKKKYDTRKLRGRIVEKFGTITGFANRIGIAVQTISSKLNNEKGITKDDIFLWSEVLEIDHKEVWDYFFTPKV